MKKTTNKLHSMPEDVRKTLSGDKKAREVWDDITPLARNEWICWITSAKKSETRERRLGRMLEEFEEGKRRPCCWAGCPHR